GRPPRGDVLRGRSQPRDRRAGVRRARPAAGIADAGRAGRPAGPRLRVRAEGGRRRPIIISRKRRSRPTGGPLVTPRFRTAALALAACTLSLPAAAQEKRTDEAAPVSEDARLHQIAQAT